MYRGRFAPSPTGDLHLGSAASALIGWLAARSARGTYVLRVEDIDTPRVRAGVEARQLDDLRWLGLDWNEGPDVGGPRGPYRQSERTALYDDALTRLAAQGLTYLCDCSRAEIAQIASAPHVGDEGPRYPGTCRDLGMRAREWKRAPAVRLRVPARAVTVRDRWQGVFTENVLETVGDFVLRRGDGVYAYQLAVVVDDLAMGITEVVRGVDLLGSAARQVLLAELLGQGAPAYAHHPMVVGESGERLAKRAPGVTLRDYRGDENGSRRVVAILAAALGLECHPAPSPGDLLGRFVSDRIRGQRVVRVVPP